MKYCKNCGMQLDTETQVCPKCGTGLTDDISDNKFKKEKKRHKRRYCILVILLIVVIAAAMRIGGQTNCCLIIWTDLSN